MANPLTRAAIKKHSSASSGQNYGDPINLAPRKTKTREEAEKELPIDRIKGFGNV